MCATRTTATCLALYTMLSSLAQCHLATAVSTLVGGKVLPLFFLPACRVVLVATSSSAVAVGRTAKTLTILSIRSRPTPQLTKSHLSRRELIIGSLVRIATPSTVVSSRNAAPSSIWASCRSSSSDWLDRISVWVWLATRMGFAITATSSFAGPTSTTSICRRRSWPRWGVTRGQMQFVRGGIWTLSVWPIPKGQERQ